MPEYVISPDKNGCYGWPRECDHIDDLECLIVEQCKNPAFRRYWTRYNNMPLLASAPIKANRHRGWRRGRK